MGNVIFSRGYTLTLPHPPKNGVNMQFQVKTPKYKNRNIRETTDPIKTKFEDQAWTNNSWVSNIT